MMDTSDIVRETERASGDATCSNDTKHGPTSKTKKSDREMGDETHPSGGGTVNRRGHDEPAAVNRLARNTAPYFIIKSKFEYPPAYPNVPPYNNQPSWKGVPVAPSVTISATGNAVTLVWNIKAYTLLTKAKINAYELYVCKETERIPDTSMWILMGTLKALELPMRCTVDLLAKGFTYHFALRAVDEHGRRAPFTVVKTTI